MNNPVIEKRSTRSGPLKEYITSHQEREKLLEKAKDTDLDGIVRHLKQDNAQFDWSTLDENGLDLEARIAKHAMDIG